MATVLDRFVTIYSFKTDTRELQKLEAAVDRAKGKLKSAGTGMIGLGASAVGAAAAVGQASISYDRAVNALASVSLDAPAEAMERFRQQAAELGAQWGDSATAILDGQRELKQSGLDWLEVLELTPVMMELAVAGNIAMADSARVLVGTLNTYNLEASEAARVSDVLAKAAGELFPTTLGQMEPALRQVAGLASNLGLSFETTVAGIGVLRKEANLTAEMSGTALRNVLSIMVADPTGPAEERIKQLGVEWTAVQKAVTRGDLSSALRMLRSAGFDAGDAIEVFGREMGNAALAMILSVDSLDGYTESLGEASGQTAAMAALWERGISDSWDDMIAAFNSATRGLGEGGLVDAMIDAFNASTDLLRGVKDLPEPVRELGSMSVVAGTGLLGVGAGLKAAAWAMSPFLSMLTLVGRGLLVMGGAVGWIGSGLALLLDYLRRLNDMSWSDLFGGFWDDLAEIGRAFSEDGFIAGFKTIWETTSSAVTRDLKAITEDVSDRLGLDWWVDTEPILGPAFEAGAAIPDAMAAGIDSNANSVYEATNRMMEEAYNLFPQSDAMEGPFSNLTASGRALGETFAAGVRMSTSDLRNAVVNALSLPVASLPAGVGPGGSQTVGGARSVSIVVEQVVVQVPEGTSSGVAAGLGEAMRQQLRSVAEEFDTSRIA